MEQTKDKLVLKNVSVLFYNQKTEKFGESISVDLDEESEKKVRQWAKDNNLGSGDTAGEAQIKVFNSRYDGEHKYFTFKLDKRTEVINRDAQSLLPVDCLDTDAKISLCARAVPYSSAKYGSGVTHHLTSVLVVNPVVNKNRQDSKDLVDGAYDESGAQDVLPVDEEISSKDVPEINMDRLPF